MATIEQNYRSWNSTYKWPKGGDEWSDPWGSAIHQWHTLLLPRIYQHLPARHILEIAPGHGRWTQFLLQHAEVLSVVDLSEACIERCKERFADHKHISYYVNKGRSLESIADNSIDFVFSFDSLVHAENDVICDYLREIQRVLCPGGSAVIHHSNLAAVKKRLRSKVRRRIAKYLKIVGIKLKQSPLHWRATSVSADLVLDAARGIGFPCTGQEVFRWIDTTELIDCISVFWKGDAPPHESMRFENALFQADIQKSRELLNCYRKHDQNPPSSDDSSKKASHT